jgi:hypothetical protein
MNYKARETRATWAFMSLFLALFVGADAFANRETADYYHDRALGFFLVFLGIAVLLYTWNAVQYAVMLRRNRR